MAAARRRNPASAKKSKERESMQERDVLRGPPGLWRRPCYTVKKRRWRPRGPLAVTSRMYKKCTETHSQGSSPASHFAFWWCGEQDVQNVTTGGETKTVPQERVGQERVGCPCRMWLRRSRERLPEGGRAGRVVALVLHRLGELPHAKVDLLHALDGHVYEIEQVRRDERLQRHAGAPLEGRLDLARPRLRLRLVRSCLVRDDVRRQVAHQCGDVLSVERAMCGLLLDELGVEVVDQIVARPLRVRHEGEHRLLQLLEQTVEPRILASHHLLLQRVAHRSERNLAHARLKVLSADGLPRLRESGPRGRLWA
mmetsp:Transcript_25352/g.59143  ORF Transcript_25352/g.59143 Transcript_25352/m.59143 type:complete len:311 (+) Transcript_25352:274-1206(+)